MTKRMRWCLVTIVLWWATALICLFIVGCALHQERVKRVVGPTPSAWTAPSAYRGWMIMERIELTSGRMAIILHRLDDHGNIVETVMMDEESRKVLERKRWR